jgi:uroporphyrinogen-III synthase
MVARLGGVPFSAPAVTERRSAVDTGPLLTRVVDGVFPVGIALTGAGVTALFSEAEDRGLAADLRRALSDMMLVCRGPKPQAALRRQGLSATIVTTKPHTTEELLAAIADVPLASTNVMLLHYGERNQSFTSALSKRGALVEDVCLYEWALPDDVARLREMVQRAIDGRIDALLVTSQVQIRFLLDVARESGQDERLVEALKDYVVVGAVGPVCAAALRSVGVVADVLPASPNSAALVGAVADYFDLTAPEEQAPGSE